jgi:hypothetical protein
MTSNDIILIIWEKQSNECQFKIMSNLVFKTLKTLWDNVSDVGSIILLKYFILLNDILNSDNEWFQTLLKWNVINEIEDQMILFSMK